MHSKMSVMCFVLLLSGFGGALRTCQLFDMQESPKRSTIYYVKPLVVCVQSDSQGVQSYA
jgi:hypothetical protein